MLLSQSSLPTSDPGQGDGDAIVHASYVAESDAVALARRMVAELASRSGADEQQLEAIRLAVSEAVTNAIVHGYRGKPGLVQLAARVLDGEISVTVRDRGVGLGGSPAGRRGLGMGWELIRAACESFRVLEHPPHGVELRMRIPLRSRARR
jgi:anti-sigma regulatory factor (Ser/Thr protein kinase)